MEIEEKITGETLQKEHVVPTPAARGRPWVKGQSGNPRGRPSRAHVATKVAQGLIDRKTLSLVDATLGWAQGGNKPMLRLCIERLLPPRREAPVWLNLPPIETRGDVREAMKAVVNAVGQGDIGAAHGLRLMRMFNEIYYRL